MLMPRHDTKTHTSSNTLFQALAPSLTKVHLTVSVVPGSMSFLSVVALIFIASASPVCFLTFSG